MHTRLVRILFFLAAALPAVAQINVQRSHTGNISNGNVAVGSNANLTIASGGNLTVASGGTLTYSTGASIGGNLTEIRSDLGLAIGTNVQAYDADLTTLAGKVIPTPAVLGHPAVGNPLPRFFTYLKSYRPDLGTVIDVVGLGSSVGNGAGLADPSTNGPLPYFTTTLGTYLNRLSLYTLTPRNYSINGSVLVDGVNTGYPAAISAGYPGKIVLIVYGMNDGGVASYNSGQTYPGVYTQLALLVQAIRAQGADPIITTTPHPHTTRGTFTMPDGVSQSYPTAVAANVPPESLIPPTSQSTPNITWQGASIPISYRHYRVNEAMRAVAREMGVGLIDVEKYWFDAVAAYGQDALYDIGESVHPNLLGYQLSYHAATADWIKALFDTRSVLTVGMAQTDGGGAIVGTTDTQTLTNKTITSATLDGTTTVGDIISPSAGATWGANSGATGFQIFGTGGGGNANTVKIRSASTDRVTANATGVTLGGNTTIQGVTATGATGSGNIVFATSPTVSGTTLSGTTTLGGDFYSASAGSTWGADSGASGFQIWGTGGGGNANKVRVRAASTTILDATTGGVAITGNLTVGTGFITTTSTSAGFYQGTEQGSSPAAPSANGWRLYAKDNGAGKTVLYVRFASGAEQQIAIEP